MSLENVINHSLMERFIINVQADALKNFSSGIISGSRLTCDVDFCGPLGGPVQHGLLGCLQMAVEVFFGDVEHLLDHLEHFWTVLLPYLHALLHGHDDVLGLVLRPVLRALLHCP